MKRYAFTSVIMTILILTSCQGTSGQVNSTEEAESSSIEGTPLATEVVLHEPSRIVFSSTRGASGMFDLYLLDPETLEVTSLNIGAGAPRILPSWSPDGSQIAFSTLGQWFIYTIQADGTNLTQVTDFRSNNVDWSPDGSQLVFQSDHQNELPDTPDIYVIDVNGDNLMELLDDPTIVDHSPRWSPGGDEILYISSKSGKAELFIMKADGSGITQITEMSEPVNCTAWAPNGEKIAIVVGVFPDSEICIISKDGSDLECLTQDDYYDNSPSWSPDGEQIVFSSDRGGSTDLWKINADGSGLVQLTDDEYGDEFPDWSP